MKKLPSASWREFFCLSEFGIADTAIRLKTEIEKIREQVQNIE